MIIFAIDALEIKLVEKYNCQYLKQKYYGRTNISDFSAPRTMVLWSSFMTGQNKEKEILAKGNEAMWLVKQPLKNTFFSKFKKPMIIDLPGYNYDINQHHRQRKLLKEFFETTGASREKIREEYNQQAFNHHRKIKEEFLKSLSQDYDLILGYFGLVDLIGHLNFGNPTMMKMIYQEVDEIASEIQKKEGKIIILSDHGMKGKMFGDHSGYGFWSTNFKDLNRPKITDFAEIIKKHR